MLGLLGMLALGVVVTSLGLSASYIEDKGYFDLTGTTWTFWGITAVPAASVALWFLFDRLGRLVVGILAGYVIWLVLWMIILSQGA